MATEFDRWEKDPFFYAAEEVQEAADRLESVYRRWMYGKTGALKLSGGDCDASAADLRRDLHATLGTAKWQLEEFEREVRLNDAILSTDEATVARHIDFVEAIANRIGMVEKNLKESSLEGEKSLTWVRLDKGEMDELAIFLSSSGSETEKVLRSTSFTDHEAGSQTYDTPPMNDLSLPEVKDHHRVDSSSAVLGAFTISIPPDGSPPIASAELVNSPPRLLSLSDLGTAESSSKPKNWYRNGFRKWRAPRKEDVEETLPLHHHQLSRGMNACYEKSKSCLSDCTEDCHKHHHEWIGALHRQLQRSQYQIQYGRPVQLMIWTIVTVLFICLFVLRSS